MNVMSASASSSRGGAANGAHYDHLLKLLLIGDSGAAARARGGRRARTTRVDSNYGSFDAEED